MISSIKLNHIYGIGDENLEIDLYNDSMRKIYNE